MNDPPQVNQKTFKSPFGITISNINNEPSFENSSIIINTEPKPRNNIQNPFGSDNANRFNEDADNELTGNISLNDNAKKQQYQSSFKPKNDGSNFNEFNEPPLLEGKF